MDALDSKAVQAFILTADVQNFTVAAEGTHTAQFAASIKVHACSVLFTPLTV
jgi:hypothetical protein